MATKSKPETAQSTKLKRATTSTSTSPATEGKRTAGAVTRSSSSVGKTPGATGATVSNVPSYLRSTQSSRTESPKSGGRKETPATKPTPALIRGQSSEKPSQPAQLQRVLFSAGPRSPTLKSPSSASSSPRTAAARPTELSKSLSSSAARSRTANARPAELVKSKTMPKPGSSSRPLSASGSLSRLGSTTGKTSVKKSPVTGPSTLKRQTVNDSNKQHVTVEEQQEAKPQVVVVEEEKTKPAPPPAHTPAAVTVEDESVESDVIVMEEDHIVEDEHQEEEEEVEVEVEVEVSTVKEEEEEEEEEDEHKEEVHTEEAAIIPDDSLIDTSEEPAVEEEEDEEEEVKVEEESNNHEIEFQQQDPESHIDEGEIIYSEADQENPNQETLIELQPLQVDEGKEVVISDNIAANAEEENPNKETLNKETLNPVDEEKGHNDVTVEAASSSVSQKPKIQPEAAKLEVIRRPAAMINSQRSSAGKKETPAAYNDVIEETKNKLMEKRKNKVRALVGAFETVISLQE